jgi:RIMS-binding protein 2
MREAAERRQQLELEHEQALAVLNAKQQEIELLQKVRWEGWCECVHGGMSESGRPGEAEGL